VNQNLTQKVFAVISLLPWLCFATTSSQKTYAESYLCVILIFDFLGCIILCFCGFSCRRRSSMPVVI
jgi:hypothetical protein